MQKKTTLDDLEIFEELVRSTQSTVYSVQQSQEGVDAEVKLAAKVVRSSNSQYCNFLVNEFNLMKQLDHPNIVKAICLYEEGSLNLGCSVPEVPVHYLLMELCTKFSLFDIIEETGMLDENLAKFIFKQILIGVSYCHSKNIFHRDIKGQNILFDKQDLKVKIIDFNFGGVGVKSKHQQLLGTPAYLAPEMNQRLEYVGYEIDVFNLGALLFFMLTGFAPFKSAQTYDIDYSDIYKKNYSEFWKKQSMKRYFTIEESCKQLIYQMLQFEGKNRPTMEEILNSEWFMNEINEEKALKDLEARSLKCLLFMNNRKMMQKLSIRKF